MNNEIIFYIVPGIIALVALLLFIKIVPFLMGGIITTGTVKEIIVTEKRTKHTGSSIDRPGASFKHYLQYMPVVEYKDENGNLQKGEPKLFLRTSWQPKEGEILEIKYLKSNPSRFILLRNNAMKKVVFFAVFVLSFCILSFFLLSNQ